MRKRFFLQKSIGHFNSWDTIPPSSNLRRKKKKHEAGDTFRKREAVKEKEQHFSGECGYRFRYPLKIHSHILNNLYCVCKCVHFVYLDLTHKRNMCIYCLLDCRTQCVRVEFSSKVTHYMLLCVCCLSVSELWKIWRLSYWSQLFRDGQIGCKCKLLCLYLLKGDLSCPFSKS